MIQSFRNGTDYDILMKELSHQRKGAALTSELKGNLEDTQLDSLLTLLGTTRKTGLLRLYYPDVLRKTAFALRRGKIGRVKTVFAPKLTDIMIDRGASKEQVEILRQSQKNRNAQGVTMVSTDSGIDYGIVIQALQRRLEMALVPLLFYNNHKGNFEFTAQPEDDALDAIFIEPGIEAERVTLDITRKVDELRHFSPLASTLRPDDHFVVHAKQTGLVMHAQTFSHYEWLILRNLFNPTSLLELGKTTRLVWDELLKSVINLLERDMIQHVSDSI